MIPSLTFDSNTFSQVCLRLDASFKPNTLFPYTISLTRQSMMLPLRHGLSLLTDLRNLGMEVRSVESERPKRQGNFLPLFRVPYSVYRSDNYFSNYPL